MQRKNWGVGLALATLAFASTASAQLPVPTAIGGLQDLSGGNGVLGAVTYVIRLLLLLAGIIAVMFLIVGGFQYILSGANEDLAKRGKTTIRNAIIGLIIIILSYTVVSIVYDTLVANP